MGTGVTGGIEGWLSMWLAVAVKGLHGIMAQNGGAAEEQQTEDDAVVGAKTLVGVRSHHVLLAAPQVEERVNMSAHLPLYNVSVQSERKWRFKGGLPSEI